MEGNPFFGIRQSEIEEVFTAALKAARALAEYVSKEDGEELINALFRRLKAAGHNELWFKFNHEEFSPHKEGVG